MIDTNGTTGDILATPPPVATPVRLPRVDLVRQAARRQQTATAISRRIAPLVAARGRGRRVSDRAVARAFRRLTDDLGASYTKFGQFAASAGALLGEDVAAEFRSCLDAGPPVPIDQVRRRIESDLGRPLREVFISIDEEPLGCASIAVVHRAITTDGDRVAVKVLRPGITRTVTTDLVLMRQLFRAIARVASRHLGIGLVQGLDNFKLQVREELDLRNEAAAMDYQRRVLAAEGFTRVVIPEVDPTRSGRRVLTMELLDGVALHDAAALGRPDAHTAELVDELVRAWFVTAIRYGVFHGDAHAGNLLALRDGRIALIDWGVVGRLEPDSHHFFRQLLRGALGDDEALAEVVDELVDQARSVVIDALGVPEDLLRGLLTVRLREIFTAPFGEIALGQLLLDQQFGTLGTDMAPEDDATGHRSPLQSLLTMRDLPEPEPIDRGLLLLGKQLLFLENYGKTHLADRAILHDRAFFEHLLQD